MSANQSRRYGRLALLVVAVSALLATGAGPAWAPHVAQLQVTPNQVRPGDTVTVFGPRGYGKTNPVEIRLGSPTGPVLGSFAPDQQRFAQWGPGTVSIPADTRPGRVLLFATQDLPDADAHIRGVPAQAVIDVLGPGGVPALAAPLSSTVNDREAGLEISDDNGVSVGAIALVGVGVAGLALLAVGGVTILVGRRPVPAAERARLP